MPSSLSPERARQLIEWPLRVRLLGGIGAADKFGCQECLCRAATVSAIYVAENHRPDCSARLRNAALERLAVLEARVEQALEQLRNVTSDPGCAVTFAEAVAGDIAAILKGDDQ